MALEHLTYSSVDPKVTLKAQEEYRVIGYKKIWFLGQAAWVPVLTLELLSSLSCIMYK